MRVLFTTVSAIGHVHPMVPLALALRARGHVVRWATGPDACERIQAIGFEAIAVGEPFEQLRGEMFQRYPDVREVAPESLAAFVFPRLFGDVVASSMIQGVIEATEAWRPDLVVLGRAVAAVASLGVRVLVTVGPTRDPSVLGRQPPNVRVERYVPQTLVLGRDTRWIGPLSRDAGARDPHNFAFRKLLIN